MLTGGFYAEVELGYDAAIAQEKNGRPFGVDALRRDPALEARRPATLCRGPGALHHRGVEGLPAPQRRLRARDAHRPRARDVLLLRMVPFVERNYNLVELGPRGTGKSHLFQQVSPYAHLVSGGKATVARMFVNNANGQRGLVCQYDVVCFDEVSGVSFDQKDGVNIMKGYMESGEFSRGKESIRADGGIVMVGNFDVDVQHQQRVGHLFGPLPPEMRDDTAFMDRIHCLPARLGRAEAQHRELLHRPLRPGQRLPVRVLEPAPAARAGVSVLQGRVRLGGALSGRDTTAVTEDRQRPAQAALTRPRDAGPRRGPRVGRAAGPGVPPAGQGAAEAHRLRRVPQHAVQLPAGRGRRREVRRPRPSCRARTASAATRCRPARSGRSAPAARTRTPGLYRIDVTEGPGSRRAGS